MPGYVRASYVALVMSLCNLMDCSPPGSSVHGILRASILQWVAMPVSRRSSQPRTWTRVSCVSCTGRCVLYHWCHLGSPKRKCLSLSIVQLFVTPRTVVHQARLSMEFSRILEWLAIPVSRGSSWPRDQTRVSCIAGRFFTLRATRAEFMTGYM